MFINRILLGSVIAASALYAIDPVTSLSISAPHNGGSKYSDGNITFTWTPPTGVASYMYVLDTNDSTIPSLATSPMTLNSSSATSLTAEATSSGSYYLHIQAVDSSNQKSTVVHTTNAVAIDLDAGTTTISPSGSSLTSATSITMSGSEAGTIYFTTDGSTPTTSSSVYSTPLTIAVGATIKAFLKDTAGNSGTVKSEIYTATAVQPTVKTTSDSTAVDGRTFATSSTYLTTTSIPRTSLTIGGTGFTKYKYKKSTDNDYITVASTSTTIDISALNSGSYTYYILGGDAYNYKSESNKKSVTFTVDNSAPTSLAIAYDGIITIPYDSNSTITKVNPTLDTQNGLITLSAIGSSEIKYSYATEPSLYSNYTNTYSSAFTLDTSSVSTGTEGTVRLYMAAKDSSGNWAKSYTNFLVDDKDPVLTMPTAKTYSVGFNAAISFDDDGNTSTVDNGSIRYKLTTATCTATTYNAGEFTDYSESVAISAGATKCLYAVAIDEVGNRSAVSSTQFTYNQDSVSLTLDLLNNKTFATVATYGATPITDINVTGSGTGYTKFGYEFDNNGTEVNSTSTTGLINLTTLTDGSHTLIVKAYSNTAYLDVNETRTLTIDNTRPSAVSISNQTFSSSDISVALNLPTGASSVIYQKNSDTNVTITANTTLTIDANATITAWAKDSAGNYSIPATATYTQNVNSEVVNLTQGWKLVALPTKRLEEMSLDDQNVWDYNGTNWGNTLGAGSYTLTDGNISKGFWINVPVSGLSISYSSNDVNEVNVSTLPNGWNLVGTTSVVATTDLADANVTWSYAGGVWKTYTIDATMAGVLDSLGYGQISTISAYKGFWIYKD